MPEPTVTDPNNSSVQAGDNSTAVGNVNVGGSVEGALIIGSHNVVGFTSDQVSTLITQISTTFQVKPFDGRCPYKGLETFNEEDSELFFGREKWIDNLLGRIKESRTLFVTGQSGSGKSSLVRAGVIPCLKSGYGAGWLYATMKPGRDPIDALANAFSRLKDPVLGKYLRENAEHASVLHECAESALSENTNQRLVLYIDQFEEAFTQLSKDKAQTFINLLDHAAIVDNGRVIILFSMRSDFVPNCATYPQLNAILNQQFVQIGAMQPEELVSAIAQPALRVGLKIDPDLIAQIINDMKGEPGALPLMQFALKDLFDAEQAKGGMIALTLSDYLEHGGISQALEKHANASLDKLTDEEKEIARYVFSGLIEIGRGTQDTRRTALSNELIPSGVQADAVKTVVQKLANARLITTDATTVTISHEKLIDAWPWLKKLVNENRDVIALQNEITADAKEWDEHHCDKSYLYTGVRLANTREKLNDKKLILSGLAQNFVDTGTQMEESQRQEEESRRQKELDDAHKLAESAQAQVKAEQRTRRVTIIMSIIGIIFATVLAALGYTPLRNSLLLQQATGPNLILIPQSEVTLGDSRYTSDDPSFLPNVPYKIDAFQIEPYEVTNQRYLLCVQAGKCSAPFAPHSIAFDSKNAAVPVVNINAIQASQFCEWLGRSLPTEIQWERAARYTDGRAWPWGNQKPTNEFANFYFGTDAPLSPVGSYEKGRSQEGIYDLAGNVWEWTRSSYTLGQPDWANSDTEAPLSLSARGGNYQTNPETAMSGTIAYRYEATPFAVDSGIGFRCVSN